MSAKDIIKKSFLEGFSYTVPSLKITLLCLVVAILLGVYIFSIYRLSSQNTFYSRDFNLSLIMITVITCAIILTIQSSIIVSLGMVGALSIVRFRTAVKNSVDLTFMFWAIAAGIITGTGLFGLAVLLSVVLSILIFIFRLIPAPKKNTYYLRIEADNPEAVKKAGEEAKKYDSQLSLQSENITEGRCQTTFEIHTSEPENISGELGKSEGVKSVSIIAHSDNTSI